MGETTQTIHGTSNPRHLYFSVDFENSSRGVESFSGKATMMTETEEVICY